MRFQFEADYFDGMSPRAQRVLISIRDDAYFYFKTDTTQADGTTTSTIKQYRIDECHVQAKLGSGRRLIDCPDGSRIETSFQDLEQHLPQKPHNAFWQAVHYAENHLGLIAVALVGIVICSVYFLQHGVPVMAKYAAAATPPSVEIDLGKQTLETLDNEKLGYFTATELTKAQQNTIKSGLAAMCTKTGNCPAYTLNFRKSPTIGANAFALPGGQVVMTDELVALADNNDEIVAVLAHELGHVKGRHALRQTLQGTISGIIIIAITGDVSSIASGLPALMLNMKYTRELESEADDYAFASLTQACMPTKAFATILLKLTQGEQGASVPEMISSHPDTKARVAPFFKTPAKCNQ